MKRRQFPVKKLKSSKNGAGTLQASQSRRATEIVLRVRIFLPGDGNWTARDCKKFCKSTSCKFEFEKFDLVNNFRQGKYSFHATRNNSIYRYNLNDCYYLSEIIIFPSFLATAGNSRFDKRAPVRKAPSSDKDQQKISFFVNFSIPPRGDDVTCVSLKRDGKSEKSLDSVGFESKTLHFVRFDQSILDAWFNQSLTFKIHSR